MKNLKIVIISIILILVIISLLVVGIFLDKKNINEETKPIPTVPLEETSAIYVVPTMRDSIKNDTSWCATFGLVWNDMKNDVVKQDIVFTPQELMAENLNKEDFNEDMISDEYYYKVYGKKTVELKETIEKGIKEKFNQTSDILDDFDWSSSGLDDPNNSNISRYFFYTMLYRKFEFLKEFDKLDDGKFGNKYDNVKYFGINGKTENKVGDQITVLYYNSQDDFAILINTKTNDEVIFVKNPKGNSFNEIYDNMQKEEKSFTGKKEFQDIDEFKAPNIEFNVKREYTEFANKPFLAADGDVCMILKALQSIKLTLNEKGGEIKSEAAIDMVKNTAFIIEDKIEPRYFFVDNSFTLFLREKGRDIPYFAAKVDDITKYQ